jgi:hypothetical protein
MRSAARTRALLACLACAACVTRARPSRADEQTETSYGRVEGDVTFVVGAGTVVAPRGLRGAAELRARYLDAAGIFATYEDGALFGSGAEPGRVVSAGLEVRPLFLFRWLQGHETGIPRLDLVLDSFGIEMGWALFAPSGEGLGQSALQVGVGIDVPVTPRATGLWVGLHAGLRWSDATLASGQVENADDRNAYLALTLSWHEVVLTHLVDWKDQQKR